MTGKRNRKKIAVIAGLCLVLLIGGVYAYFFQSSELKNPFSTANPSIEVVENFNPADQWLPGEKKRKEVTFTNTGDVDVLMRFKVEVSMIDSKGVEVQQIPEGFYTLNWSDEMKGKWYIEGKDKPLGYYYYNAVLAPGASTGMTLKSVAFTPEISNDAHETDYSGYVLHVKVVGEAIQADSSAVSEEWNMNVSIDSDKKAEWSPKE